MAVPVLWMSTSVVAVCITLSNHAVALSLSSKNSINMVLLLGHGKPWFSSFSSVRCDGASLQPGAVELTNLVAIFRYGSFFYVQGQSTNLLH